MILASRPLQSLVLLGLIVGLAGACKGKEQEASAPARPTTSTEVLQARALFGPLPSRFDSPANPTSPEKVALGRLLYFEPRMSLSQTLSCNSCHRVDRAGVDGERFSKGHQGKLGGRNSPSVFNAAGQIAQFWDGRAPTVEEQAKGPVLNPVEMAMPDATYVLSVLRSIPGYEAAFHAAFPGDADPINFDNFGRAIGAFERGLVTPTRFDEMLGGKDDALDVAERAGLAQFISSGCAGCHTGPLVGGSMYMKLGLMQPYANTADPGRYGVTKNEGDRYFFKVPSLRNVTKTGPYFHDGSIPELPTAIKEMGRLQLNAELTEAQVASIQTFLATLSGEPPANYVEEPPLLPAGPNTPAPREE